jgi:hypothetical protein
MRSVIIGVSAAGCQAAETLRRFAPQSPLTLISGEARFRVGPCSLFPGRRDQPGPSNGRFGQWA